MFCVCWICIIDAFVPIRTANFKPINSYRSLRIINCCQERSPNFISANARSNSAVERNDSIHSGVSRRSALLTLAVSSVLSSLPAEADQPAAKDLFGAKFQAGINKRTQRLYGCQTQANCVSVSANKNPTQFVAPWDYTVKTGSAAEAWKALSAAVERDPSLRVVQVNDTAFYLRAEAKSKVPQDGTDDVEFLLIPSEKIVTYRSASRQNVYIYPYQVAIPDGGFQRQRMRGMLQELGWVELNYAGDGVYSDGCGPNGDQTCNALEGPRLAGPQDPQPGQGGDELPRPDRFRLPF